MTLHEQIDIFLFDLEQGEYFWLPEESPLIEHQAIEKMLAIGLVVRKGSTYRLTEKGYEAAKAGGLNKWGQENERLKKEIHQATLDTAKATVNAAKSAKRSTIASWLSAAFAVIAVLFSIYQYAESVKMQKQINELEPKERIQQLQVQKPHLIESQPPADSLVYPKKKN